MKIRMGHGVIASGECYDYVDYDPILGYSWSIDERSVPDWRMGVRYLKTVYWAVSSVNGEGRKLDGVCAKASLCFSQYGVEMSMCVEMTHLLR